MRFGERIRSDAIYAWAVARLFRQLIAIVRHPERTISDLIADNARRFADRPALILDDEAVTYRALDEGANRYARWARALGLAKGEVVGLLMRNRPQHLIAWIGIARAGGVTALLNTEQVGESLAHSIRIVAPDHIVLDAELAETLETARAHLDPYPTVWATGGTVAGARDLDLALGEQQPGPLSPSERVPLTTADPCLYIYTSGTTGLPKAATITHYRVLAGMRGFAAGMGTTARDRVYVPLPLFHATAALAGVGSALAVGGAAILKKRFSTTDFWSDCVRHGATVFVYIGELCRYLVNAPPSPDERRHRLRLAFGNGLRVDVWQAFKDRFNIPRVIEFYAATEGNVVIVNYDGAVGSLGRIPSWLKAISTVEIVRFDAETELPQRDAAGRCIRCRPGEVGEAIGRIETSPAKPIGRFDGYADREATKRKVLADVFAEGDRWFRTGDLMRRDRDGYFYFVDRIGDTFRWKGENVATFEVADVIGRCDGVGEVNVYGIELPGRDGRAGMAALVIDRAAFDLVALADHIAHGLPDYARPVLLRVTDTIATTATMKHSKLALMHEGYDPARIADDLYYADSRTGRYLPLDAAAFARINSGEIRL